MKISVFDKSGKALEAKDVKVTVFDAPVNPALIHEVVVSQQADRREAAAKVKTRAEVSGGGRKPYKQKGTGRARTGSIRNPLWRGGGAIFGPTGIQNFARKVLKKKRTGAILSALATKKADSVLLTSFEITKTKDFAKLNTAIAAGRKALYVFNSITENNILVTRNVEKVRVIDYRNLNVYDILWADKLVFVGDALEKTNEKVEVK